jgi:hypothetical protein
VISVILAHLPVHDGDEHVQVTAPVATSRENTAASSENPNI